MNTSSQTHSSIISTYYPPEIPSATLVFQSHQTPQTNSNTYGTVLVGQVNTLDRVNIPDGLDDSHCHQNTYYQYDKPDENFFEETGLLETDYRQTFLAGKLAKSSTDKPYMNTTWYSYDEQGRLVWMVQNIAGLGIKTVDYQYDSKGNIADVIYQKHLATEAFYHKYLYDVDNRLLKVKTSTNGTSWEKEAEYQYYVHGPLKRLELADDLQGIDYLYTVQGQLKSINSPNLGATASDIFKDPGADGTNEFATDVFGMSIDYFSGDYTREGTYVNNLGGVSSTYSGNINALRWNTQGMSLAASGKQNMYAYSYENHNWLSGADFGVYTPITTQNEANGSNTLLNLGSDRPAFTPNSQQDYQLSNVSYDTNGNLLSLSRNGYTDTNNGLTNTMDALLYKYATNTAGKRINNKLTYINDVTHNNDYADVQNQAPNNYQYNKIGQLEANQQEGHYYTYDAYGLLTGVYTDENHSHKVAKYFYDDKGFRVRKILYQDGGTNLQSSVTWYVRDASGNLLSLYEQDVAALEAIQQTDLPIYGSSRIGQYQAHNEGQKTYELTDHLGNVRALIEREKVGGFAQTTMVSDYYPYGMKMPGRQMIGETPYRYSYQGQFAEKDEETGLHSFEARLWDARIARWTSMDPVENFFSPYAGMHNNPLSQVDPDGRDPLTATIIIGFAVFGGVVNASMNYQEGAGFMDVLGNFAVGFVASGVAAVAVIAATPLVAGALVLGTCLLILGGMYLKRYYKVRRMLSQTLLKTPIVGPLIRLVYLGRFARAMYLLLKAKVPILQALDLVNQMILFIPLNEALSKAKNEIEKGGNLSQGLQKEALFDLRFRALLKVAEQSNSLALVFNRIALQYAQELTYRSKLMRELIEPLVIIGLGLIVALILVAMYLPIFNMNSGL